MDTNDIPGDALFEGTMQMPAVGETGMTGTIDMRAAAAAGWPIGPPLPQRTGEALKRGDARAWEAIYRAYEKPLYGFLYRLAGDPHLATDLVQETFLRTMARFRDIDVPRDIKPYLYTASRNLYFKHREKHGRVQTWADTDEALPGGPRDLGDQLEEHPEGAAMLGEQAQLVRAAMAKLPDRQRQALSLCDLEECSYAQIGEILEIKENAVAQLILRGRTKLRLELRLLHTDTSAVPMECIPNLAKISRMLDEALAAGDLQPLQEHLDACEPCTQVVRDFEEARHRFRSWLPPLWLPSDEAWSQVMQAASDKGLLSAGTPGVDGASGADPAGGAWLDRNATTLTRVAVGCTLLLLVVAAGVVGTGLGDEPVVQARKSSSKTETTTSTTAGAIDAPDEGDKAKAKGKKQAPRKQPQPAGGDDTDPDPDPDPDPRPDTPPPPPPPPPPSANPDPPTYADVTVTDIAVTTSSITVYLGNVGQAASGSFTVAVQFEGTTIGTASASLAAGASGSVSVAVTDPCDWEGTYDVLAIADSGGGVTESNEGNNTGADTWSMIC